MTKISIESKRIRLYRVISLFQITITADENEKSHNPSGKEYRTQLGKLSLYGKVFNLKLSIGSVNPI